MIAGAAAAALDARSPAFAEYLVHHVVIAALGTSMIVLGITALVFDQLGRLAQTRRLTPLLSGAIDAIGGESEIALRELDHVLEELNLRRDPTQRREAFNESRKRLESLDGWRALMAVNDEIRRLYEDHDTVLAGFREWIDGGQALDPQASAERRDGLRAQVACWQVRMDPWSRIADTNRLAAVVRENAAVQHEIEEALRRATELAAQTTRGERALKRENARLRAQIQSESGAAGEPAPETVQEAAEADDAGGVS